MANSGQDATHPVTPTRLQQATRQGNTPRSTELASSIQLLCGLGVLYYSIQSIGQQFHRSTGKLWSEAQLDADKFDLVYAEFVSSGIELTGRIAVSYTHLTLPTIYSV